MFDKQCFFGEIVFQIMKNNKFFNHSFIRTAYKNFQLCYNNISYISKLCIFWTLIITIFLLKANSPFNLYLPSENSNNQQQSSNRV